MVPIVGRETRDEGEALRLVRENRFTHGYQRADGTYVDGSGGGAECVWARANESTRRKPNCVFKMDCLVTARRIRTGEELFVYYGSAFTRHGYSVSRNRHLERAAFPCLDRVSSWPTPAERRAARDHVYALSSESSESSEWPTKARCTHASGGSSSSSSLV